MTGARALGEKLRSSTVGTLPYAIHKNELKANYEKI